MTSSSRRLLSVIAVIAILSVARSPAAEPNDQTDEQKMASWWEDLTKGDPQAARAVLNFAGKPEQTVAYFKERLKPLALSEEDLAKLLTDLSSEDETVWKPAYEKLEYFDPRLAVDLPKLMVEVTDAAARRRLVEILVDTSPGAFKDQDVKFRSVGDGQYNFEIDAGSIWAEPNISKLANSDEGTWENNKKAWLRAIRAIVILEHIGTPEAVAIIKAMSTGHPDAAPTHAAAQSLDALNKL